MEFFDGLMDFDENAKFLLYCWETSILDNGYIVAIKGLDFTCGSDNIVEVAKSLNKALHFNTYGGNPVACAIGSSVIDVSILSVMSLLGMGVYL